MAQAEIIPRDEDLERASEKSKESYENDSPQSTTSAPITKTVTAQDWTGPDDPENPLNWSLAKKSYHTAAIAALAFAATFATSAYTPAVSQVAAHFGVSTTAAILPLSLYTLGLGFGPMLSAPASETAGRLVVYLVSAPLCMLFTVGSGFAKDFGTLLVCRLLAGFFGSPVLAVGAGSNADMWSQETRAVASSLFIMSPFLGPGLGPVAGGFTVMSKSWRWTQWDILFVFVPAYLFSLGMKESYKKIILRRRAKRLGVAPPVETVTGMQKVKVLVTITIARPMRMLITEPIVGFMSLYVAFNFAVLYAFFAAFPIVFEGIYGFNPGESGLTFLAIAIGVLLGGSTAIVMDRLMYHKLHVKMSGEKGVIAPEHRLYAAMAGSFGLPVGLFWFAWTARRDTHWISPVLAAIPFAWGNTAIFISAMLYMIDTYGPLLGASAAAANGFLRYLLGAAFPLFTIQMYTTLHVDWATSLFGFISIGLLPIPWVLFKWGKAIRRKSAYESVRGM